MFLKGKVREEEKDKERWVTEKAIKESRWSRNGIRKIRDIVGR